MSKLLKPPTVGELKLPNSVVMAPLTRNQMERGNVLFAGRRRLYRLSSGGLTAGVGQIEGH
jgi:2,4-dienoyl-CoA reductase-like NADH-dependent reductase (Old Yellow Enzyme family)